jgi:type I restriction enzyme, S subunit
MTIESLFHSVPQGWELISLGEICKRSGGNIQTGPFGSQLHAADYVEEGVPSIMPENIGDNQIITTDIARIKPEDAERLSRYIVRNGDIIYSRRGDITRRALIQEKQVGWLCGTGCLRIRLGEDVLDPYFAFYYLGHPKVRNWIALHAVGATMPNLNTSILSNLPFLLPPLEEQKSVTRVCQLLDRKISNLRQQNETLEKIAQTLFKHWFVDFEFPNEDGKPYKSSGGEMVRSELGEIPVGWGVCKFKECLEHLIDNRGKTPEFFSGGIPALSAKFVKGGDLVNRDSFNYVSYELFAQAEKLKIGDVILTSEAPLGETYFIARQTTYYPAQRVFALRADTNVISCSYLNYWLSSSTGQFFLKRRASGSTVQGIKQSELYQCEIIIPEKIIQCRASGLLTEILNKKEANSDQIQTLTQTRDRLLPKLMSGQLRIQED